MLSYLTDALLCKRREELRHSAIFECIAGIQIMPSKVSGKRAFQAMLLTVYFSTSTFTIRIIFKIDKGVIFANDRSII